MFLLFAVTAGETPSPLSWSQAQRRIGSLHDLDPPAFEAHFVFTDPPDLPWEESDHADAPLPSSEVVAKLPQLLEASSGLDGGGGGGGGGGSGDVKQRRQQLQQLVFLTGGSNPIEAGYGTLKIAEADAELTELLRLTRVPLAFLAEEKAAEKIWDQHVSTVDAEERWV